MSAFAAFSGAGSASPSATFDAGGDGLDGFMSVGGGGAGSSSGGSGSISPADAGGRMSSAPPAPSASGGRVRAYVPVASYAEDSSNDAPLLSELGVDFAHIAGKVAAVLHPTSAVSADILADSDMAGPLLFVVALGVLLLLNGKVHFGAIYGFGGVGVLAMHALLNLLAEPSRGIDLSRTFSVLGYCLLPLAPLAALAVVARDMRGPVGGAAGAGAVLWAAWSATRIFEAAMHMRPQRWLVFYPALLLYSVFVLMTIF